MLSSPPRSGGYFNNLLVFGGLNSWALSYLEGGQGGLLYQLYWLFFWQFMGFAFSAVIVEVMRYRRVAKFVVVPESTGPDATNEGASADNSLAPLATTPAHALPVEAKDKDA